MPRPTPVSTPDQTRRDTGTSGRSAPRGAVEPFDHVGRGQLGGTRVVASHLLVAEDLTSGARAAPAEERDSVADDPRGWRRSEAVRAAPHALERGRLYERGPGRLRNGYPEPPGQPAHLALEVGAQVVVAHQQHVRRTAPGPGIGQVPHDAGQR